MRTTLTIDDDLLAAAQSLARHRGTTLSAAVCELIRRGLKPQQVYAQAPEEEDGFPRFQVAEDARPITLEDVRRLEDLP